MPTRSQVINVLSASISVLTAAERLTATTEKRLDYVWNTISNNDDKLWLLHIVFVAVGLDDWDKSPKTAEAMIPSKGTTSADKLLEAFREDLRSNSPIDGYIPWLATKIRKGVSRQELEALERGFRKIVNWASTTKTDIGKMTVTEALEKSAGLVRKPVTDKEKQIAAENPVVYTFADGWFIRNLVTDQALKHEGEVLNHCVGTYCSNVKGGYSVIYSLRNPQDEAQVTMEYSPSAKHFKQMFGDGNADPTPEQQKYLIEFVKNNFSSDIRNLSLAGESNFQGISLIGAQLPYAKLNWTNLQNADLERANLENAYLFEADLKEANLYNAILNEAHLEGAHLEGANLQEVWAQSARLEGANLEGANLEGADLQGANLDGANLQDTDLQRADFRRANLSDANLSRADLSGADLRDARLDGINLQDAILRGTEGFPERYKDILTTEQVKSLGHTPWKSNLLRQRGVTPDWLLREPDSQ